MDYDKEKEAILTRYGINSETYWWRFCESKKKPERHRGNWPLESGSHQSVVQGICNSRRDEELIAVEQFLNILPTDIQVWFRERKPKTTAEADQ